MINIKHIILCVALLCGVDAYTQNMQRYELDVRDFSELRVIDGVNVDYRCVPDSAGKAVFYSTADVASAITFTNDERKRLEIKLNPTEGVTLKNIPRVMVYSKFLVRVENRADSTVRVYSPVAGPSFKAHLEGNGRLVVRDVDATTVDGSIFTGNGVLVIYGKCISAKLNNKGVGSIQADELVAENVKCTQIGTGYIGCNASRELTIFGASGKVYYHGTPVVKNRTVGVKIVSLDEKK